MPVLSTFTGPNAEQIEARGPFKDGNGNYYMFILIPDYPDDSASELFVYKSTTSGSSWFQVGYIESGLGASLEIKDSKSNQDIFVILTQWDIGYPSYTYTAWVWNMSSHSSPDTWGTQRSTSGYGWGTSPGTESSAWLVVQQANNNFSVMYNDAVLIGGTYYARPYFFKVVNNSATYDVALGNFSDTETSHYVPLVSALQADGNTWFAWVNPAAGSNHYSCRSGGTTYSLGTTTSGSHAWLYNMWPLYYRANKNFVIGKFNNEDSVSLTSRHEYDEEIYTWTHTANYDEITSTVWMESDLYGVCGQYATNRADWLTYYKLSSSGSAGMFPVEYLARPRGGSWSSQWAQLPEYFSQPSGLYSSTSLHDASIIGDDLYLLEMQYEYFASGSSRYIVVLHKTTAPRFQHNPNTFKLSTVNPTTSDTSWVGMPAGDRITSSFVGDDNIGVSLYDHVDGVNREDADWITSQFTSGSGLSVYQTKISSMSTPSSPNGVYAKYSYWLNRDPSNIGKIPSLRVRLVEGPDYPLIDWAYTSGSPYVINTRGDTLWGSGDHSSPPSALVDNDFNTSHECAGNNGCSVSTNLCWKMIDLGVPRTIRRVVLGTKYYSHRFGSGAYGGWVWKWKLMWSNDNITYHDVATYTRDTPMTSADPDIAESHDFDPISARYWKIKNVQGSSSTSAGWCLWMFQLWGDGDQYGKTTIAEWTHSNITEETPVLAEQLLTTEQVNSITNWRNLFFEFEIIETP